MINPVRLQEVEQLLDSLESALANSQDCRPSMRQLADKVVPLWNIVAHSSVWHRDVLAMFDSGVLEHARDDGKVSPELISLFRSFNKALGQPTLTKDEVSALRSSTRGLLQPFAFLG